MVCHADESHWVRILKKTHPPKQQYIHDGCHKIILMNPFGRETILSNSNLFGGTLRRPQGKINDRNPLGSLQGGPWADGHTWSFFGAPINSLISHRWVTGVITLVTQVTTRDITPFISSRASRGPPCRTIHGSRLPNLTTGAKFGWLRETGTKLSTGAAN